MYERWCYLISTMINLWILSSGVITCCKSTMINLWILSSGVIINYNVQINIFYYLQKKIWRNIKTRDYRTTLYAMLPWNIMKRAHHYSFWIYKIIFIINIIVIYKRTDGLVPGGFAPLPPLGAAPPDPRKLCRVYKNYF